MLSWRVVYSTVLLIKEGAVDRAPQSLRGCMVDSGVGLPPLVNSVTEWLEYIGLGHYATALVSNG